MQKKESDNKRLIRASMFLFWLKNNVFSWFRVKRILRLFFSIVIIVFIGIILLIYSSVFQTIVSKILVKTLSEKMGLEVSISNVSLDVFHKLYFKDFLIRDLQKDTMVYLKDLKVDIQYASIFHKQFFIKKITLDNPKIYAVRHKGDKDFNYEKIVDFFSAPKKQKTQQDTSEWKVTLHEIELNNATLIYKDEKYDTQVSKQMNYSYLKLSKTNLLLSDIHLHNDTVHASIKNLNTKEQCGFQVKQLRSNIMLTENSMQFKNFLIQTPISTLYGNYAMLFNNIGDLGDDFIELVTLKGDFFSPTKLGFADLVHFTKEMEGWENFVEIAGHVEGKIKDLKIDDAEIKYAGTKIIGDIRMTGLPNIDSTYFDIKARQLTTYADAVQKIPLYPFTTHEFVTLPKQFKNTGINTFVGSIKGYYHSSKIQGNLVTEIGSIKLHTHLAIDKTNDLVYKGELSFIEFNFGKFFRQQDIGNLNADIVLDGNGTIFKTMKTSIQANIKSFYLHRYTYQNIMLDANLKNKLFIGDLASSDPNASFSFSGQIGFDNKIPEINFIISVDKLNLSELHFMNDPNHGILAGTGVMKLTGDNVDDMSGSIQLNNLHYITSKKDYDFSGIDFIVNQKNINNKKIEINSPFIDASISGKYDLSSLQNYVDYFIHTYYPSFEHGKLAAEVGRADTLSAELNFKNTQPISELFTDGELYIAPKSKFLFQYRNKDHYVNSTFRSSYIQYGKYRFEKNLFAIHSENQQLNMQIKVNKIDITDSLFLENTYLCSDSKDHHTKFNIEWNTYRNNKAATYTGQVGGNIIFYPFGTYIIPDVLQIPVGKEEWIADEINPIIIDTAGYINFFPLVLKRKNQAIKISGELRNKENDELKIAFENFSLHQLNPLLTDNNIVLKGVLDGSITFHQSLSKKIFSSDINIQDLNLNNHFIGNISTRTSYNPSDKNLYIKGDLSYNYQMDLVNTKLKYLDFEGFYYTQKKDSSLDIAFEAKPFNLAILNPYLTGIMTFDYAFLIGKGRVDGTPAKPLISGNFVINDSKVKIDYLNAYYKLAGNIEVMPDQIRFDDIKVFNYGSKELAAFLNGNIFHNNFANMRLDFDVNAKNMLVLNTNSYINKDYYGKIYAAGTIGLYGFINDIHIETNLTSKKNSAFTLSFSNAAEVGENTFVKFIKPQDSIVKKKAEPITGLNMDLILNATPDLATEVIFNDKTGDGVKAKGNGLIRMNINSYGKFEMTGEYTIESGQYLFTLESIINKKFDIQNGSKVLFTGNPYNAMINLTADYHQKTSIAPLFPYDSSGTYKRRYPVYCQLLLKNKLMAPDISFNIDIPSLDAATKSRVQALMSDENELNRQVFSLLLLKTFVTPLQYSGGGGVSAGTALAANGSEMLSNRLSSAFSSITNFVDIGFNYNPGSQSSNQQVELTMSKQMFNNRLSVDGSFGVNNNQSQNTSQVIGDVNVEYKLTESGKYHLKAFNRTNNNTQLAISGGPYTQGIGIGYKEEFNTIGEYFRKLFRRPKKD